MLWPLLKIEHGMRKGKNVSVMDDVRCALEVWRTAAHD